MHYAPYVCTYIHLDISKLTVVCLAGRSARFRASHRPKPWRACWRWLAARAEANLGTLCFCLRAAVARERESLVTHHRSPTSPHLLARPGIHRLLFVTPPHRYHHCVTSSIPSPSPPPPASLDSSLLPVPSAEPATTTTARARATSQGSTTDQGDPLCCCCCSRRCCC